MSDTAPDVADAHDARGIANILIQMGIQDGRPLTPLQVVKLTYLCHGWMLGLYHQPLSAQPAEAWKYGPVIPDVYHEVKIHGRKPITMLIDFPKADLDFIQDDLVRQVYRAYEDFSGIQLSQITHEPGTPWYKIWHEYGRNTIIPNSLIEQHYASLVEQDE